MELLEHTESTLRRTVQVVCGLLAVDAETAQRRPIEEAEYRSELIACILTSRVSSVSAQAALARLTGAGLLSDSRWQDNDATFESDIASCLRSSTEGVGAYRFPNAKAAQLASLRAALRQHPLSCLLFAESDMAAVRRKFVQFLPGVGPKQASMFLRNIGATYDLAILDAHVIRFLHAVGMIKNLDMSLSTLSQYEKVETHAIRYAKSCEQDVGYLDWAIWITMRAAREMRK
jgi:N-glycosylase/DNA lyase